MGLVVVVVAAGASLLARFGPPGWLLAGEHPVRTVLEGLSWPAGVMALLWVAVPSVLRWARPTAGTSPADTGDGTPTAPPGVSVTGSTIMGPNIQIGGNLAGGIAVGDTAPPSRRSEPWEEEEEEGR